MTVGGYFSCHHGERERKKGSPKSQRNGKGGEMKKTSKGGREGQVYA